MNTHSVISPPAEAGTFSAARWRKYFESNRGTRLQVACPESETLPSEQASALIRSLQRFQVGETGDGRHLKKFAREIGDNDYMQCIDLFITEENEHAQLLSRALTALGGSVIDEHWSDYAFMFIRRTFGLQVEIFTLFVAEVIGLCFYERVRDSLRDYRISNIFRRMVTDEIAHIEFHTQFMRYYLEKRDPAVRRLMLLAWSALYAAACAVFVVDHRSGLKAAGTTPGRFWLNSTGVFLASARRACRLKW